MRRLSTSFLFAAVLVASTAADAHAADPTTRPSVMIDLPQPNGPVDPRLGLLLPDGQVVRVVRAMPHMPAPPGVAMSVLSICSKDGGKQRDVIIPDMTVEGLASAGPGRVLIWGPRFGTPSDRRQMSMAIWGIDQAKRLVSFDLGKAFIVGSAAVAANAPRAVVSLESGRVQWFDTENGREHRTLTVGQNVGPVALSADGQRLAAGGSFDDEVLHVWDLAAGREIARGVGHHGPITSVAFSKDDRSILTSSADGSTRIWDAANGRELKRLRPAGVPVANAVFSPDERRVYTTLGTLPPNGPQTFVRPTNQLRLWDVESQKLLMRYDAADAQVSSTRFSVDGSTVDALLGNQLWTWAAAGLTSTSTTTAPAFQASDPPANQSSPDDALATGGDGASFSLGVEADGPTVEPGLVIRVGFFAEGQAYSVHSYDGRLRVWNLDRKALAATRQPAPGEHFPQVADVSRDGRRAVGISAAGGQDLVIWDLASGLASVNTRVNAPALIDTALSPDGTLAAVLHAVGNGERSLVTFFRTNDGTVAGTIDPKSTEAKSIAFSPDGNRVAIRMADERAAVQEFDLDSGKRVATYGANNGDLLSAIAYSADGKRLAAVAPHAAYVWETNTSRRLVRMMYKSTLVSVALSPDGSKLVTGGMDSNVRVIDMNSLKPVGRFDEPKRPVTSLAISPDGQWILAGSNEQACWVFRMP